MTTYRKTPLECIRGNGYGQYLIRATYKGREIIAPTTDASIFDWINDDSNKAKHQEAKRAAYLRIKQAHNAAR